MVREKAWNVHLSLVLCQVVCRSRPRARVSGRQAAGGVREIPGLHVGGRFGSGPRAKSVDVWA